MLLLLGLWTTLAAVGSARASRAEEAAALPEPAAGEDGTARACALRVVQDDGPVALAAQQVEVGQPTPGRDAG